jgi:hypothetical protein
MHQCEFSCTDGWQRTVMPNSKHNSATCYACDVLRTVYMYFPFLWCNLFDSLNPTWLASQLPLQMHVVVPAVLSATMSYIFVKICMIFLAYLTLGGPH